MHVLIESETEAPGAVALREIAAPSSLPSDGVAGNDATFAAEEIRVTDGATAVRVSISNPYLAVRAHRAMMMGEMIAAAMKAVAAGFRHAFAKRREYREARAFYDAFRRLDDHMLRDLGFDRSDLEQIAWRE
jgi:uncharacterized protein YjiS (DUF1127 family)